jgi:hypothetical protein
MIGTKVIVGYDQHAVVKGLKGMTGLFGRTFRQVGIGAARQIGVGITNALAALPRMAFDMAKDFGNLNDQLTNLSRTLDIPIDRLYVLREAMRLGGVEAPDILMALSKFASNISEGTKGGSFMGALQTLFGTEGEAHNMIQMRLDSALEYFAKAYSKSTLPIGTKMEILGDAFGIRRGAKFGEFLGNFSAEMKKAEEYAGDFGRELAKTNDKLEDLKDELGRIEQVKTKVGRSMWLSFDKAIGGQAGLKGFFDSFDKEYMPKVEKFIEAVGQLVHTVLNQPISASMQNLADMFGEAMGSAMARGAGNAILGIPNAGPQAFPLGPQKSGEWKSYMDRQISEQEKSNAFLKDIKDKDTSARFTKGN